MLKILFKAWHLSTFFHSQDIQASLTGLYHTEDESIIYLMDENIASSGIDSHLEI